MMTHLRRDILACVGGTPLVPLRRLVPGNGARILLKLESQNPTGSMKDRMALAMIEAAEADGRLRAGGSVVEYTGGSTGVSLALVCTVKGYTLHIVTSDAFAREKLDHMRALGAHLRIVASEGGGMTGKLTRDMIEAARVIAGETGGFWTDQMNNRDQLAAYHRMADEIWDATDGRIDHFVQSVGTAASLRGIGDGLRRRDGGIGLVAVEPAEQDRRHRGRLCRAAVAQRRRRPDRAGVHGRGHGDGHTAGAGGRDFRGHLHRRQCRRRPAPGRAIGAGRHHRHRDVRYGHEIPQPAA